MSKIEIQGLIDQIQRSAHLLNKEGYDVAPIFDHTRSLNRQIVEESA